MDEILSTRRSWGGLPQSIDDAVVWQMATHEEARPRKASVGSIRRTIG